MSGSRYLEQMLVRIIITFGVLVIIGIALIGAGAGAADAFAQTVLVSVGAATFGGALAFFLVEMFQWGMSRSQQRERGRPVRIHNEQPPPTPW